MIAPGARQLGNEAFGAEFREVVTEGGEGELFGGTAKGLDNVRVDLGGGEGTSGRYVGKAHEGVHEGELSGVVEFETRDAPSGGGNCRLRELAELTSVDEGLQDILLHVEIVIGDL